MNHTLPTHTQFLRPTAPGRSTVRALTVAAGVVAAVVFGLLAARTLAATTAAASPSSAEQFAGRVDLHERHIGFEVNRVGGSLHRVRCAHGAGAGATCWLANGLARK